MSDLQQKTSARSRRIISLLPSATEIVCSLGAETDLVGVSHECDFPLSVQGLPVLTSARIPALSSSRSIDEAVRSVLDGALSIYSVDDELLANLRPEVIVTQDLCEVCAVSLDDVQAALARLAGRDRVDIVSLRPTRLDHVFEDLLRVANAIGRESRGLKLRRELKQRVAAIAQRAKATPRRPRVVTIEWFDPIMIGGTWMPEMIELAGGQVCGAKAGDPAPTISSEQLKQLAPEIVVIKPCGFSIERSMQELDVLKSQVLDQLPPEVAVYVTDGNAYFNRPGPRLVESLEILAACVHPELFSDLARAHARVIQRL